MARQPAWAALAVVLSLLCAQNAASATNCSAITKPCELMCSGACAPKPRRRASPLPAPATTAAAADAAKAARPLAAYTGPEPMSELIKRVTAVAEHKAFATTQRLTPQQYPVATTDESSTWETVYAGHWMSGLFVGVMWQLYELTGRAKAFWAQQAALWQAGLADRQRDFAPQHDFGFIYLPSFAHSYAITNSTEDKRQALAAAEALSWAFNPATKSLRTFEGWRTPASTDGVQQIVIIDFMMNIQLLVWGAKHVAGPAQDLRMDKDPATTWLEMAKEHARQVTKNHIRPDGTTYHIVEYNPKTGDINKKYTYQGHADNSTWARGQAWALTGFAMLANATGEAEFRDTARTLADKYLELLSSQPTKMGNATTAAKIAFKKASAGNSKSTLDDGSSKGDTAKDAKAQNATVAVGEKTFRRWRRAPVPAPDASLTGKKIKHPYDGFIPQWDFDAPWYAELDGPRDTSAAAVAALGLLHLAELEASGGPVPAEPIAAAGSTPKPAASSTPKPAASSTPQPAPGSTPKPAAGVAATAPSVAPQKATANATSSGNTTSVGSGPAIAGASAACGSRYLCAAVATLRALASEKYISTVEEEDFPAILKHATGGFPLRNHVDVGLISGDYYFLAALSKCASMPACLGHLPTSGGVKSAVSGGVKSAVPAATIVAAV